MKSLFIAFIFSSFLVFALAAPSSTAEDKEEKAIQECNVTNPVQRNPRQVIAKGIANGEKIELSQEEKCHLYCFLKKVNFFDENGNLRSPGLINYTIRSAPELAPYSDLIIAELFNIIRSTKKVADKCHKAFVVYIRYGDALFSVGLAAGMNSFTGVKDTIINAIEKNEPIPPETTKQVEEYLWYLNALLSVYANDPQKQLASTALSKASELHSAAFGAKANSTST